MKDREAGEMRKRPPASPLRGGLNLNEAAQYLGVGRRTVERMVAEASIGVVRIGSGRGRVIIPIPELDRYLTEHLEPAICTSPGRVRRRVG
ncbi:MAG: excisionase family DNA-binding protein [Acidimicrobiales bacterium]